jgi:DNA-binding transcriptional ArsR family regulator
VRDVFKALADPTRRTILDELTDRNGQTLFEICSRLLAKHGLGSSRQAISQHLDVLEAAGLVETSREGRYKFHYINTAPLEPIVERWLNQAGKGTGVPSGTGAGTGGRDRHEDQHGQRAR